MIVKSNDDGGLLTKNDAGRCRKNGCELFRIFWMVFESSMIAPAFRCVSSSFFKGDVR